MAKLTPVFIPMQGDCRELLAQQFDDNSIDAGITDPPYGIGFMGKKWDTFKPGIETQRIVEARKSTNPNVIGRKRSPASSPSAVEYDRTLGGQREFQVWTESWAREMLRVLKPGAHLVVFGAPRSHHRMMCGLEDAGFEIRDTLMWLFGQGFPKSKNLGGGIGTALKPAWEPIALARKPLGKLTATKAMEVYGTGGLAIDVCRVGTELVTSRRGLKNSRDGYVGIPDKTNEGRWPANLLLDTEAATLLGAESRFFYCPKVSTKEREFGCEHLPVRTPGEMTGGRKVGSAGLNNPRAGAGRGLGAHNAHPTVKPIALMRWLVQLVTPPSGIVVDPFVGSGSTAIAAILEGHRCFGFDLEEEWLDVSEARVNAWKRRGG